MKIIQYMLGIRNADGGVVRAFVDLCQVLAARGHEVICLTADDRDAPRDWDGQNSRPKLITLQPTRAFSKLLPRTTMECVTGRLNGADIVHLHVPWDPICAQLARLCRRRNLPYIVSLHGMLDDWTFSKKSLKKRAYLSIAGRAMLEHAAFVHCTAEIEKQQSSKWYPNGRTVIAALPFDLSPFANLPGPQLARETFRDAFNGDESTWLFVGRLHPIKRIELLIEACRKLKNQGTPGRMLIAGAGEKDYEHKLRSMAAQLGVADRVRFLGFVTGREKLSLYQAVEGLALPSAHESFGYSVIEALACGTPVITTQGMNIWQELKASGGAAIVEPTADALAAALIDLRKRVLRQLDMGHNAREWIFNQFETNRVGQIFENMYEKAAPRPVR